MKESNYIIHRTMIINYLHARKCFCFKSNITHDLIEIGMTKTSVSETLKEMRKRKEIKKGFRRWGL